MAAISKLRPTIQYAKSNQYYQRLRVGGAHFAQQNKTAFLLNRYIVFRFIGVDYEGCEADRPSAGARREAASTI